MRTFTRAMTATLLASGALAAGPAHAQQAGVPADPGLQLMSPVNGLMSLSTDVVFRAWQGDLEGAGDQDQLALLFDFTWPVALDSGATLMVRARMPVSLGTPTWVTPDRDYQAFLIRQQADTLPDGHFIDGHGHLDDLGWDVGWGRVSEAGVITLVGLAGVIPVSQDGSIERDQYLLGPDLALGRYAGDSVYGLRFTHYLDVYTVSGGKPKNYDTNETHLRPFWAHSLGNGWQLQSEPDIVYDWEGADGNQWQVPLGGGIARSTRWFGLPLRWSAEAEYFIATADAFGPDWQVRFNLTPVFRGAP